MDTGSASKAPPLRGARPEGELEALLPHTAAVLRQMEQAAAKRMSRAVDRIERTPIWKARARSRKIEQALAAGKDGHLFRLLAEGLEAVDAKRGRRPWQKASEPAATVAHHFTLKQLRELDAKALELLQRETGGVNWTPARGGKK